MLLDFNAAVARAVADPRARCASMVLIKVTHRRVRHATVRRLEFQGRCVPASRWRVGGEFGIALLTLPLQNRGHRSGHQRSRMLVAVVLGMVLAPVILANNKRVARLLLGERGPPQDRHRARRCRHAGAWPSAST